MTLTLSDTERKRRFEVEQFDGDLRLTMSAQDRVPSQSWLFSRLCPVSLTRPWDLKPQALAIATADESDGGVVLTGRSMHFITTAAFTFDHGRLRAEVQWQSTAAGPLEDVGFAFALELRHDPATERITMPHILYNGNPSASPERLVPRFGERTGDMLICERTRFPIPCVNVEWIEGERPVFVSLFSLPGDDEGETSLGVIRGPSGLAVLGTTGLVALNGEKDRIYGKQNGSMSWNDGYLTLQPGEQVRRTWLIDIGQPVQIGHAFREVVRAGFEVFEPRNSPVLSLDRVIDLKVNALNNRWHEDEHACGYLCALPDSIYKRPPYFLFGWTGQDLRLAWCSAVHGLRNGNQEMVDRCRRATDFYVSEGATPTRGLRYNYYFLDARRWSGPRVMADETDEGSETDVNLSSRAVGEAAANLGKVIRLFRDSDLEVPPSWVDALRQTADFVLDPSSHLREGIVPRLWGPDGRAVQDKVTAAGISCVSAVLEAFEITAEGRYLTGGRALLANYWRICGDRFDRPFSGATLDASCEDQEAGLYFFLAADHLHRLTGDKEVRKWAEAGADWILTFIYLWHTGFRNGTICDRNGFNTVGWPGVSVQNHHLDVYFPAFELFDFGRRTGNDRYERLGRLVFDAWSQGICTHPGEWEHRVPGEQGEHFYQTNYFQGVDGSHNWRGGHNPWNPSWIIAIVLEAAFRFKYEG